MTHKLKKFCKITRYIEQIDGELSQMISDLCLDRLFIPRGVTGITFLYPKEPSYRKEIITSAYSDNPEKAIQMLESLIVLDYLPRPGDFVLKRDDIPNSLHQRIEVTSADASSVKLACGAVLKPDAGFAPISTRENMAVYILTGSQIPLNGAKASMKYSTKRRAPKSKDYSGGDYSGGGYGHEVSKPTAVHSMLIKKAISKGEFKPLISAVVSWLSFLMSNSECKTWAYDQWHDGLISRDLVATYYTSLMGPAVRGYAKGSTGSKALLYFTKWDTLAKTMNYEPITKSKDTMTEGQNLITQIIEGAQAHEPTHKHGSDEELRKFQRELSEVSVIQKKAAIMGKMYSKFYEGLSQEEINARMWSDETGYIIDLLVTQSFEDDFKRDTISDIDDMVQMNWIKVDPTKFYILNDSNYKGSTNPANLLSGVEKMSNTDRFLGGPRSGKHNGDPDPEKFLSVSGGYDDNQSQSSLQAMFGGLMGEGQASILHADALRTMLGGL